LPELHIHTEARAPAAERPSRDGCRSNVTALTVRRTMRAPGRCVFEKQTLSLDSVSAARRWARQCSQHAGACRVCVKNPRCAACWVNRLVNTSGQPGVASRVLRISAGPGWVRPSAAWLKERRLRTLTRRWSMRVRSSMTITRFLSACPPRASQIPTTAASRA